MDCCKRAMGFPGWPAEVGAAASCTDRILGLAGPTGGLGFRLRAFAAVLEMYVQGGFSQTLSGEIGLSEIQIVFVNVFICPETMKWNPESLRETHLEATVACFEFPWQIGRKSSIPQFGIIWPLPVLSWQTGFNQRQAGAGLF